MGIIFSTIMLKRLVSPQVFFTVLGDPKKIALLAKIEVWKIGHSSHVLVEIIIESRTVARQLDVLGDAELLTDSTGTLRVVVVGLGFAGAQRSLGAVSLSGLV